MIVKKQALVLSMTTLFLIACASPPQQTETATIEEPQSTTQVPQPTAEPTVAPSDTPEPAPLPSVEAVPEINEVVEAVLGEVRTLTDDLPAATGGVAIDGAGNIFVGDIGPAPRRGGTKVYKITTQGEVSIFAQGQGLLGASGNAFDSQGNLYQSNLNANTISRITPDGEVSTFVSDGIAAPVGIAIDAEDNLFVTNCGGNSIQKVTQAGESTQVAASPLFRCPNGIALDEDGNLYVANFRNGLILKVTPDGSVSEFATVPGRSNGHITYDSKGTFYIAARNANQIYTLNLAGELELFAGTGERGYDDGPLLEATFSLPNDLNISPSDDILYINQVLASSGTRNYPSVIRMIMLESE